ncbi:phage portal protein [Cupriavidus metallidurans]|uniref:phage portal protein n=1 Tax=Cupriavidus metallidurans TaxID=119219 RepID=UPI001CC9888B|nr:phage portal protein [Cupriavidus metallidurans]UBM12767.1 phage portal protein [Cupriavidus metallidurans]
MDQKKLLAFLKRRHPLYEEMAPSWVFYEETYEGGRSWFNSNIFKYMREGDDEYAARVHRAYRFNHTREVVDLVNKHLFKMPVARNEDDAPPALQAFWKSATLNNLPIREFMDQVGKRSSTCGRIWLVIDNNYPAGMRTRADEAASGGRIYSYIVRPYNFLDCAWGDDGMLSWALVREAKRDDSDPLNSTGGQYFVYRLWTRTFSQEFRIQKEGQRGEKVDVYDAVVHDLGLVPIVPVDNFISDNPYDSPSMVADVAFLDRACANYLSNLDAIIQDQTFSQLVIPAQGLLPGSDEEKTLVSMGTKRIFTYNGEGGAAPSYISPDVKQAELILQIVNKIINEIYHSVGLAGERTKQDNAQGIDNSSGVAKAYDFERVNALLANKADALEAAELQIARIVCAWAGQSDQLGTRKLVEYADNFDVRSLYNEFEIAAELQLIQAPDQVRRRQMELVVDKLFPQLKEELKKKMLAELEKWPPQPEPAAASDAGAGNGNGGQAPSPVQKLGAAAGEGK